MTTRLKMLMLIINSTNVNAPPRRAAAQFRLERKVRLLISNWDRGYPGQSKFPSYW